MQVLGLGFVASARARLLDAAYLAAEIMTNILNRQDLRAELGLTYLLISHNLAMVEHIATRVAVMYLGRMVEQTDTPAIFERPRHPDPDKGAPDTHLGAYPNPLDIPGGCSFHPRCPKVTDHCPRIDPRPLPIPGGHVERHFYDGELTRGALAHAEP